METKANYVVVGSFVLAVATSPRDLTRRLACADWLDDRGRAERAAFWRLPAFARWEADCGECRERKLWPYLPGVWERDKADVCLEAAAEGADAVVVLCTNLDGAGLVPA